MLVITLKNGETFTIGDEITVQIVRVDRNRVKVGITAPKEKRILRGDLRQAEQSADDLAEAEAEAERIRREAGIRF